MGSGNQSEKGITSTRLLSLPPSALILCLSDPNSDPRPIKVIKWLSCERYDLTVAAYQRPFDYVAGFHDLTEYSRHTSSALSFILNSCQVKLNSIRRRLEASEWNAASERAYRELSQRHFDLVICFDAVLLPLAHKLRRAGRLLFDAREYYPGQFTDRPLWRFCLKEFASHLCLKYLPQCDAVTTVSEGLKAKYQKDFCISAEVLYSYADFVNLAPSVLDPDRIKVIYHGNANRSRETHRMIEVANLLDERFHLDLMVLPTDSQYVRQLESRAAKSGRASIVAPQPFGKIVPTLNAYDIGMFFVPPNNVNLLHCMPNKLFEFVQARLAIAVGPSPDMRDFVLGNGLGISSDSWRAQELAQRMNALEQHEINAFKKKSHECASKYLSNATGSRFKAICASLLDQMR